MSSVTLPLLQAVSANTSVVTYHGKSISVGYFAAAANRLAHEFPQSSYAVNLCENRYWFLLGWAAACLRDQITLLPPNQARGTLSDLATRYPEQHVFDDALLEGLLGSLDLTERDRQSALEQLSSPRWQISSNRVVALTFTSGSTGMPQAHAKTWGALARNAQLAAAEVLGGAGTHIVATVPAQHVYGLETSALVAFAGDCPVYDGKPFFPRDVSAALAAVPEPRSLVTTPTHLKTLLEARIDLPATRRVISATAPLPQEWATQAEDRWRTEVFEIYGCTEAGVMARRRTSKSLVWETFSGGRMEVTGTAVQYSAPQLAGPIPLQDIIEPLPAPFAETRFHLRGRSADMIKVAGKRIALQELTQQLVKVSGVQDAVIFIPHADARPVALVVAPHCSEGEILQALAEHVDAVFLPRPLILVPRLPRNELGKLPQAALLEALEHYRKRAAHD